MDRAQLKRLRDRAAAAFQEQTEATIKAAIAERERGRALGLEGIDLEAHVAASNRERRADKGRR